VHRPQQGLAGRIGGVEQLNTQSSSVMSRGVPKVVSLANIDSRPCGSRSTQGTSNGGSAGAATAMVDASAVTLGQAGNRYRCRSSTRPG